MKKFIISLTTLYALTIISCSNPKEKGTKGQAYLSAGYNYKGQAMVDLPIFCYGPEFENILENKKANFSAVLETLGKENVRRKADWIELENTYLNEVKALTKKAFEVVKKQNDERIANLDPSESTQFKEALEQQQLQISVVKKEIQELEAQKRATSELVEVLSPYISSQRRLLNDGYANVEAEISRANALVDKINKVIIDNGLALSLYERFNSDIKKEYTNIKNCWNESFQNFLSYPRDMVARESYSSIERLFTYDKEYFSKYSPLDANGRVVFATRDSYAYISYLPKELTPYISNEIKKAYYKHIFIAIPLRDEILSELRTFAKVADNALLVYANKNGISKDQVEAIIEDSKSQTDFERQIVEKRSHLNTLENRDILAEVATEVSELKSALVAKNEALANFFISIDDAVNFDALYEEYNSLMLEYEGDTSTKYEFIKDLESAGIKRPDKPELLDYPKDIDDSIFRTLLGADLIVRTDLSGEFLIPDGMTRYFTYTKDDASLMLWTATITETTDKVLITSSSVTAYNPIALLFSESELDELLCTE